MNLTRGEIVLIEVPFHQAQGAKIRPAVVALDTGDEDCIVAPITSRARSGEHEFSITSWQAAGLNTSSNVRIHKVAVIPKAAVKRRIGALTPEDLNAVQVILCRVFCAPLA